MSRKLRDEFGTEIIFYSVLIELDRDFWTYGMLFLVLGFGEDICIRGESY